MSTKYDWIKKYYDMGSYNKKTLGVFVYVGWLTEEEYQAITGEALKKEGIA